MVNILYGFSCTKYIHSLTNTQHSVATMLYDSETLDAWNMLDFHEMLTQLLLACFEEEDKKWMKEKQRIYVGTVSTTYRRWLDMPGNVVYVYLTRVSIIIVTYIHPKNFDFWHYYSGWMSEMILRSGVVSSFFVSSFIVWLDTSTASVATKIWG